MIVNNKYFTLRVINNSIQVIPNWENLDRQTDSINLEVYDSRDKFHTDIRYLSTTEADEIASVIVEDGSYLIVVKITCSEECDVHKSYHTYYEYYKNFYGAFLQHLIPEIKEYLCKCENCRHLPLDKCNGCADDNECTNLLSIFSYFTYYVFTFLDNEDRYGLEEYSYEAVAPEYKKLITSLTESLNYGYLRGQFKYDEQIIYLYMVIMYVFLLMKEIYNTGVYFSNNLSEYLNYENVSIYDFQNIRKCIEEKGYDVSKYIRIFSNTVYKGDFLFDQNYCDPEVCDISYDMLENYKDFKYSKADFEKGLQIYGDYTGYLYIAVPKIYGQIDTIMQDLTENIIDLFDLVDMGSYCMLISKDKFINPNMTLKFKFR